MFVFVVIDDCEEFNFVFFFCSFLYECVNFVDLYICLDFGNINGILMGFIFIDLLICYLVFFFSVDVFVMNVNFFILLGRVMNWF